MKTIPFTIQIGNNAYTGFLGTSDLSDPPTSFFVFVGDFIIGKLLYQGKWIFNPGIRNTLLKNLDNTECKSIADNLGNIAVLAHESTCSREEHLMPKRAFKWLSLTAFKRFYTLLTHDFVQTGFGSKSRNVY
jgi:hypothetical protein